MLMKKHILNINLNKHLIILVLFSCFVVIILRSGYLVKFRSHITSMLRYSKTRINKTTYYYC